MNHASPHQAVSNQKSHRRHGKSSHGTLTDSLADPLVDVPCCSASCTATFYDLRTSVHPALFLPLATTYNGLSSAAPISSSTERECRWRVSHWSSRQHTAGCHPTTPRASALSGARTPSGESRQFLSSSLHTRLEPCTGCVRQEEI